MSEWREEDDVPPPWYRRNKGVLWLIAALAVAAAVYFMFRQPQSDDSEKARPIAMSAPYMDPRAVQTVAPAVAAPPLKKTSQETRQAPPAPPAPFAPAMISYPLARRDAPAMPEAAKAPEQTGVDFKTSQIPGLAAGPAIDMTLVLMPGILPCELDTAINSDIAGPILCHLPGPVYSPKGVLLMEADSIVTGSYRTLQGRGGASRLQVDALTGFTPNGVPVSLAGQPMSDGLGNAGLSGTIDRHYWERFGGAVLLDLSQSALSIIQAKVSQGGNVYLQSNGTESLANQILQSTINIPDTFTKHQGQMIGIFLTEPVSFKASYRVTEAPGRDP